MTIQVQNLLAANTGFRMSDGTQYVADAEGNITVANPSHLPVLLGTGFVLTGATNPAPPSLNLTDATALVTAFAGLITARNQLVLHSGGFTVQLVASNYDTVYFGLYIGASSAGSQAWCGLVIPVSMPAQGSIGATLLSSIGGGASDDSSGVVYPGAAILSDGSAYYQFSAQNKTVDLYLNGSLTLA